MARTPEAPVPPTSDLLDITGGLDNLRLGSPRGGDGRRHVLQPAFAEIVGMLDPIRDSFHNLLLSGSACRLSSPSSGTDHSIAQECLMANSVGDPSPLSESPKGTPPMP